MTTLSELASSRELVANLTLRELRGKYKRSVIGWGWSLINPLATMAIFTVVFGVFLRVQPPVGEPSGLHNFAFFLMCGLLPWNFMSNAIVSGTGSLLSNANLIKKVWFPRETLVGSTVLSLDVAFLIELGVLAVALLIVGNSVLVWLPLTVGLVVLLTTFVLGLALAFSVVNVYFRDVEYLLAIGLQMWFYATPIVYPISLVPERGNVLGLDLPIRALYELNPMVHYVEAFRDALYHLRAPSMGTVGALTLLSLVSIGGGAAIFTRFSPRLAEEL